MPRIQFTERGFLGSGAIYKGGIQGGIVPRFLFPFLLVPRFNHAPKMTAPKLTDVGKQALAELVVGATVPPEPFVELTTSSRSR